MLPSQSKDYYDQVIEAAFHHLRRGFYFIGPFSRRVSFASQQIRAIDLVNALRAKGKLTVEGGRKPVIAVIGGGIAGLTTSAMLRGYGCSVCLFEEAQELLHIQRASSHRLVHPTIARWPGIDLKYTTEFGMLDWCAGSGAQVIATMANDWQTWLGPKSSEADYDAYLEAKVHKLIVGNGVSVKSRAVKGTLAAKKNAARFDLAIVTVGFGKEIAPGELASTSYWTPDDDQMMEWRKSEETIDVIGCGDGAIIDCLRLVHGHFRDGWLVVRLAQLLQQQFSDLERAKIEAMEHEALLTTKSIRCMDLANGIRSDTAGSKPSDDRNHVSEELFKFYSGIANRLPDEAKQLLDKSIETASVDVGKVLLAAPDAQPFTPYSAPIHKIMLADAMNRNLIIYRPGRLEIAKGESVITCFDNQQPPHRTLGDRRIMRLGAKSPLDDLLETPELESLRLRQFMLADFLDIEKSRDIPALQQWPGRASPTIANLYTKFSAVEDLFRAIRSNCRAGIVDGAYCFDTYDELDSNDVLNLDLPDAVFGINVQFGGPVETVQQ